MRRAALYVVTVLLVLGWCDEAWARCAFSEPVELAEKGEGWRIPATWARRGLNFGTSGMIGLIQRAAKTVARSRPGSTLFVGDISRRKGGPSKWHKSHACGCDVDLLFFAVGADGKPIAPPREMIPFNARGVGVQGGKTVQFDTARNWTLVKALLQDRVRVERMFIHASLKRRLLAYAKRRKEDAALIARADERMIQPADAGPHDDHLHVRIARGRHAPVARDVAAEPPAPATSKPRAAARSGPEGREARSGPKGREARPRRRGDDPRRTRPA